MPDSNTNILAVGVGGQGIILASEILTYALMNAGYDVKKSEVHGMSQRGGSVNTHIRFGKKVYSPVIKEGEVDILFAFEQLEALRYFGFLKPDAMVILNNHNVNPPSVSLGIDEYPRDVPQTIKKRFPNLHLVNGLDLALKIGNSRTANIVLLGVLSRYIKVEENFWIDAISKVFPEKLIDINIEAFRLGRKEG
ncbi:MAG: indolepyruvate oxidoreductase subunit beta [Deltaproteobacteria bacterium CG12_big_fil_rev_8_21_14_0_65_43_10]|nr:MAG: indolepyruvate oxidoreductase subunit beta [Deltaproteobacteria bacterium CG2_30_43_15]PIQ46395.1 MAG: indolepyruvate oxidoreductase subunit beta [Deltaproteobacteria bacterium CG12_big_fil_rev_8_21_14_0_65_43_10]PIU84472.1 MAG: indolepyruvate oxidoreductase subunit beta [Deltaproteobacteria bacterium CG06_land_8_20_14_3_00_44_19]PIX22644.1 MAG: indolepyruvate oxidoreductase subunit beta [Deltaproteobacteria bacterium CG_4_8_14_3_um_filter_43_13]PIZ19173.1 MAG: indolepyruvate oxidoreduc